MELLFFAVIAGTIAFGCHALTRGLVGREGYTAFVLLLVSVAASLLTAWLLQMYTYIQIGEVPEPPGVPICVFVMCLPISMAAGAVLLPRQRRVQHGRCKKCRYNLTGNVSGVCPECGTKIER